MGRGGTVVVFSGGGTGGHLYPALALMDGLSALRPDVRPFFMGARKGLEAEIVPDRGLDHLLLPVQGIKRGVVWRNFGILFGLVRSLVAAGKAFTRMRPGMVVVTGGYAGGPAGIMAGLMGIPLALQEQNSLPGATTRLLSRWARQVYLAFPEARRHLPEKTRGRVKVSGNPVRSPASLSKAEAKEHFDIDPGALVVLVTGGSQGAEALNRVLLDAIGEVVQGVLHRPESLQLLWATGPKNLSDVQDRLETLGRPPWVRVRGYINDMPEALAAATLAIGRAGAMTTSEFLASALPALLVPLPTAAADHQTRNAESLAEAGVALHFPESELSGEGLWNALTTLLTEGDRLDAMVAAARNRGRPDATMEIAEGLALLLPEAAPQEREMAS